MTQLAGALIEVAGLQAGYGSSQVLFDISLSIHQGEVATLLGRNGMGKTTTVRALCGLTRPSAGSIRFKDHDIAAKPADWIARQGIALVPEGRQVFPNLTVLEHLIAFAANRSGLADPWTAAKVFAFFRN